MTSVETRESQTPRHNRACDSVLVHVGGSAYEAAWNRQHRMQEGLMGRARESWEQFSAALEKGDDQAVKDLFAPESVYLEPNNPPHEGHLLIQAYLNSWMSARDDIDVTVTRLLESEDGLTVAVEWALTYTAAGRRWTNLPRASWIEVDEQGIRYHRDYY